MRGGAGRCVGRVVARTSPPGPSWLIGHSSACGHPSKCGARFETYVLGSPSVTVESQILSSVVDLVAPGARIEQVQRFRSAALPFPARLVLTTGEGSVACVVKVFTDPGSSRQEASTLRALEDLAFAAPSVMAGPHVVPTSEGSVEVLVMSPMPGEALPWIEVTDVRTADRTCRLLFEAIDQLHALTPRIAAHTLAADIPRRTLDDELAAVAERKSPWVETRVFHEAMEVLHKQMPRYRLPVVFSNGDYNPLNVIADDDGLIGWVDFELACFEDPLIGLPKFGFWADDSGWSLANHVGLVERYLYQHQVTPASFMVRVALRGLTHLHDTTPDRPPLVMLREIERAVAALRNDV